MAEQWVRGYTWELLRQEARKFTEIKKLNGEPLRSYDEQCAVLDFISHMAHTQYDINEKLTPKSSSL